MDAAVTDTAATGGDRDMPGGDRKGPDGRGPMTGRGLGYCAGYDHPGYVADALPYGRGYGRGGGRGFGRGRGFRGGRSVAPPAVVYENVPVETGSLVEEVARLREQLKALEHRLSETESDA